MSKKRVHAHPEAPASDRWLRYATLPMRLFLGATFVYAALQKVADPGFLQPGSSTYIGTQLQAFASQSPIGPVIEAFALPSPQLTGLAVIATELAVGVLVLVGVATRWAAVAGALVNFVFFLSASWNVQPYFLGSDSIYTVAWITLALVGDQGVWTARPVIFGDHARPASGRAGFDAGRRRFLLQAGGAAVAAVFVLAVLPRQRRTTAAAPRAEPSATPTTAPTPSGTKVGSAADLRANGFLTFSNPANGDPAIAVSLANGNVVAYDAVCTHAGCTVQYDAGQRVLACPCHGAVFDPAHNASVLQGPAPTPLDAIRVQVASDGNVYAG